MIEYVTVKAFTFLWMVRPYTHSAPTVSLIFQVKAKMCISQQKLATKQFYYTCNVSCYGTLSNTLLVRTVKYKDWRRINKADVLRRKKSTQTECRKIVLLSWRVESLNDVAKWMSWVSLVDLTGKDYMNLAQSLQCKKRKNNKKIQFQECITLQVNR